MRSRVLSFCISALFFSFVIFSASTGQPQTNETIIPSEIQVDDISKAEQLIPVINKYIRDDETNLPLILAVIKAESNFNSTAESAKGALGLMQLMPYTAMDEYEKVFSDPSLTRLKRQLIQQPELNIALGVRFLQNLDRRFAEIRDSNRRRQLVLASYNAGSRRVKLAFGCLSDNCLKTRVNRQTEMDFSIGIKQLPMETRSYLILVDRSYRFYTDQMGLGESAAAPIKRTRNDSV